MSTKIVRSGLVAEKLGMTRVFSDDGQVVPVTLLQVLPCTVIGQKTEEKDGYRAIQVGYDQVSPSKLTKPMRGVFERRSLSYFKKVKEFRVEQLMDVGSVVDASHFEVGQMIDVSGVSIGKGFAGGMKRHNFGGLRASHGVSVSHRSHGSTGNRQDPGKVFKNKKMAGHMGSEKVTVLNLKVQSIDLEKNLIFVKGAVPGSVGSSVYIRDAVKALKK